jgi:ribosomal protein L11
MLFVEDWRRATMQAEYAVYMKITVMKSTKRTILAGTPPVSSVVPAKWQQRN